MTDDAVEESLFLTEQLFIPNKLFNSCTHWISQRSIHNLLLIYAVKHKSHSVVHYFSNPLMFHWLLVPVILHFEQVNLEALDTKNTTDAKAHMGS